MKTIVLLILFCLGSPAATVAVSWGANLAGPTWGTVRVYERQGCKGEFTYTLVAEVPGNRTSVDVLNVAPGEHVYVARSANTLSESSDSYPQMVTVPVGK